GGTQGGPRRPESQDVGRDAPRPHGTRRDGTDHREPDPVAAEPLRDRATHAAPVAQQGLDGMREPRSDGTPPRGAAGGNRQVRGARIEEDQAWVSSARRNSPT